MYKAFTKMHVIVFILISFSTQSAHSTNDSRTGVTKEPFDYCSHPDCSTKNQHTLCLASDKRSPRLYASGVTTWMRYALLLLHNRHRDTIAMGLEPGQPPATNMRKMYWDYELEHTAEVWARQCQKRHDECRNTVRFNVLQNMDVRPALPRVTEAQLLADAVGGWFSGSRALPVEHVWSFRRANCSAAGGCNAHWYSAAAWASTWRLGCSQALCTARRRSCILFRKRRRFNLISDTDLNVTRSTTGTENVLRRTRHMTTEPSAGLERFTVGDERSVPVDSPLHRGAIEHRYQEKKRRQPTILVFTVCNYGPAGNVEGFPIYEAGSACSNCPQGTQCGDKTHRALCTVIGDPDIRVSASRQA